MKETRSMMRRSAMSLLTAATLSLPSLADDTDPWVFDDSRHPVPAPAAVSTAVSAPAFVGASAETAEGTSSTAFDTRLFSDAISAVVDFVTRVGSYFTIK